MRENALALSAQEDRGINLEFGKDLVEMICALMLDDDNFTMGGRRIKALVQEHVQVPLNRWILFNQTRASKRLCISVADDNSTILINGKQVP